MTAPETRPCPFCQLDPHRIVAEDGTLHCDGHAVVVWVDRRTGKSRPLPEGVRRAHESLMV